MVTVDTVKDLVRPFARLLHSSPLIVFNYLVSRVEGLDGGILNTWVECLKVPLPPTHHPPACPHKLPPSPPISSPTHPPETHSTSFQPPLPPSPTHSPTHPPIQFTNNLALDVGSFILLQRASDDRPKLQSGLPNEAPHFKALATFTGLTYKKYPQVIHPPTHLPSQPASFQPPTHLSTYSLTHYSSTQLTHPPTLPTGRAAGCPGVPH